MRKPQQHLVSLHSTNPKSGMQQATLCSIFSRQTYPLWNITYWSPAQSNHNYFITDTRRIGVCVENWYSSFLPMVSPDNPPPTHSYQQTNSMEQRLSWEAYSSTANTNYPTFYETQRFITAFTRARHLSLSSATSIQSIAPHYTSLRSISILSSHLDRSYKYSYHNPWHSSITVPVNTHSTNWESSGKIGQSNMLCCWKVVTMQAVLTRAVWQHRRL